MLIQKRLITIGVVYGLIASEIVKNPRSITVYGLNPRKGGDLSGVDVVNVRFYDREKTKRQKKKPVKTFVVVTFIIYMY